MIITFNIIIIIIDLLSSFFFTSDPYYTYIKMHSPFKELFLLILFLIFKMSYSMSAPFGIMYSVRTVCLNITVCVGTLYTGILLQFSRALDAARLFQVSALEVCCVFLAHHVPQHKTVSQKRFTVPENKFASEKSHVADLRLMFPSRLWLVCYLIVNHMRKLPLILVRKYTYICRTWVYTLDTFN